MKAKKTITALTALMMLPAINSAASADGGTVVRLDPSETAPWEFEGWGTSLGWWGNRIGCSDTLAKRAAELFYSEDGLGLDIVRYNVGGGDDPSHNHVTRSDSKLPCLAEPERVEDGSLKRDENGDVVYSYNWDNDCNQMNVLKRIKEANPDAHIEGYTNSPPWFMTESGCSSGGTNAAENLAPENFDNFAVFLADVTEHMKEIGLPFDSYSPMNEPNPATKYWGAFSPKQEGNHVAPGEHQSGLITALADEYAGRGIDTLIAGLDETSIDYTITSYNALTDEAKAALGRIDTHTYGGSRRAALKSTAVAAGKPLWMSEVDGGWNGFGLADRIILDMNGMQPGAWVMWDIVDFHKDSEFTDPNGNKTEANASLDPTAALWGVAMANHDTGEIELANKYYAYGQFTRYINPGDTIIASSASTLAAYNKKSGAIKIVVSNSASTDKSYEFDLSAFTRIGDRVTEIRSNNLTGDAAEHWAKIEGETELNGSRLTASAKAGTVTTFIVDTAPTAGLSAFSADENGAVWSYDTAGAEADAYLAVYAADGTLKLVSMNESEGSAAGNFSGCSAKLLLWDDKQKPISDIISNVTEPGTAPDYGVISGGADILGIGSEIQLELRTSLTGDVKWSVSDPTVASISDEGLLIVTGSGAVTVYAEICGCAFSRDFSVPLYTVTGTASWGNDSTRPSDDADYLKAVDGDLSTFFDGTQNGWVRLDYGAPFKASEIRLAARDGYSERTKGGALQGSNDGISWTELYKLTSGIPGGAYTTIAASELANDHAYRYYRYTNADNMANIAELELDGELSDDTPEGAPTVADIAELTDDFESGTNIFGAEIGALDSDGNRVFETGLARYGSAFAPVNSTAAATLAEPRELAKNELFRMTFTMFAGWESNGKDNTFAIKDKDGNEIAALYLTGGGYNLAEVRIGGKNVLESPTIGQCRSNPPSSSKQGANGWNVSGQPYVNTVGYNKTVEIRIDGAGNVSISASGGMADTAVSGTLDTPVSIGSAELTGSCSSSRERVVSYDGFDTDIIAYSEDFEKPTPPTEPPAVPENGELIHLDFDNGDLLSSSDYGTASGAPAFAVEDGRACARLDGTRNSVIALTDRNGNSLLTGQTNLAISFKVKPTTNNTSWWFFAAPNNDEQTYQKEKYLGAMTKDGRLTVERYNNSGARSEPTSGEYKPGEWNDVMIAVDIDSTTLYINGAPVQTVASSVNISEMLGSASVAYIGLANWTTGEYAEGYIDDFAIRLNPLGEISLGDTSAVTEDIVIPVKDGVSWESSDPSVITADGRVIRQDETKTATLTARAAIGGAELTRSFDVTVKGYLDALGTLAVYADGDTIYYGGVDYEGEVSPVKSVTIISASSEVLNPDQSDEPDGSFAGCADGKYRVTGTLSMTSPDGRTISKTVTKYVTVNASQTMDAYLFAHFVGAESDENCEQIYFSVSEDGAAWKTLNGGRPMLVSTVGEKGVRDPYILRGEDGKFFVIATDLSIYNRRDDSNRWGTCQTSGSKSIVVWESADLVNWSEASLAEVAVGNAGCTWAPEAAYDPERDEYMVFWASKVSDDNYSTQRVYRSYTKDFKTFSEPEVYIDGGNISNIDTTIVSDKGIYYRFTKNESRSSVTMMRASSLDGPWTDVDTYTINGAAGSTVTGYEGPTVYKLNGSDRMCLLLDFYSKGQGYKPFTTADITTGVFTSASDFTFDATYRHGTVIPITRAEYERLAAAYP